MTKKELTKALEPWPDDAQIEVCVARTPEDSDGLCDPFWVELVHVELVTNSPPDVKGHHCLLFTGKIMME